MNRDQARELLAAYALGALSSSEREELEAVLADWPEGRREQAELSLAAGALPLVPGQEMTPALGLEGRIVARARRERSTDQVERRARQRRPRWRRAVPHALAAGFAVVAVVFGVLNFSGDGEPPGGRWLPLNDGDAGWIYVTNYNDAPISLLFRGIDAAPEGRTYQLWRVDEGERVTADRTFQVDEDGVVAIILESGETADLIGFGVSLEPADGRPSGIPTNEEILFSFRLD